MSEVKTEILFLGTGTSGGVPEIACECEVCKSENPKNKRLRTSILLKREDLHITIDCSSDFRQQALKYGIKSLEAVLLTHTHHDHISGLDDLRAISSRTKRISVYIKQSEVEYIKKSFYYMFEETAQKGGGIAEIELKEIFQTERFAVQDFIFEPLLVYHGVIPILGYKFNNTAYITDAKTLPESTLEKIQNLDNLIINALRYKPHKTHLNLEESLELIAKVKPKKAYLVHTTHDMDYDKVSAELPENVYMAYDGLRITL